MRVLVIGINYAPEVTGIAPYTTGLSEHLAGRGHEVHVLTGFPHYPAWKKSSEGAAHERYEQLNGVHVHRCRHHVPARQSALRRALYECSFLGSGAVRLSLPPPDAIVATVPALSDGILARMASRRFGAPYGLILQDLMGQAARQSGLAGGVSMERPVRAAEGWIARGAARVAIVAEAFRDYVERLGVSSEKIVQVRNWTNVPPASSSREQVRQRAGWPSDAVVCLHAGNMGYKQGLENVLESARLAASTRPELLFVLMGDGNQREALATKACELRLTNVRFLPTQSSQDYADLLSAADVLLLNQSASVRDMAFPSKLSAYVASATPIVAAVAPDSAAACELGSAGAALVVDPGRPRELLEAVARTAHDELLRRRLVLAARQYGRAFSREEALGQLEAFVGQLVPVEEREYEPVAIREAA